MFPLGMETFMYVPVRNSHLVTHVWWYRSGPENVILVVHQMWATTKPHYTTVRREASFILHSCCRYVNFTR